MCKTIRTKPVSAELERLYSHLLLQSYIQTDWGGRQACIHVTLGFYDVLMHVKSLNPWNIL